MSELLAQLANRFKSHKERNTYLLTFILLSFGQGENLTSAASGRWDPIHD